MESILPVKPCDRYLWIFSPTESLGQICNTASSPSWHSFARSKRRRARDTIRLGKAGERVDSLRIATACELLVGHHSTSEAEKTNLRSSDFLTVICAKRECEIDVHTPTAHQMFGQIFDQVFAHVFVDQKIRCTVLPSLRNKT